MNRRSFLKISALLGCGVAITTAPAFAAPAPPVTGHLRWEARSFGWVGYEEKGEQVACVWRMSNHTWTYQVDVTLYGARHMTWSRTDRLTDPQGAADAAEGAWFRLRRQASQSANFGLLYGTVWNQAMWGVAGQKPTWPTYGL